MKWQKGYKKLIDNGSEGIIIVNEDTSIIDANIRAVKMMGYRLKELRELSLNNILLLDKTRDKNLCFSNIKEGRPCLFEETIVCKDGSMIDVEISGKKFSDGVFVAFIRDITDRKKIRETIKYHSFILQNLMEAVISTDVNFKILSWNLAAEQLYGWKEEEVLGKKISEVLKTDFINDCKENVYKTLCKDFRWAGEVIQEAKSGIQYHILTSLELLRNDKNEIAGYICINIDISEKIFFKNKVEESIKEFKKIAWIQSHEVRAPLTNILGLIELIDLENESADFNNQLIKYIKTSATKVDYAVKKIVNTSLIINKRIDRTISTLSE